MNGAVIAGTPIAVDFWWPSKAPQARLFFLTHLHADHIKGLGSAWRLPLYTSPLNARLLRLWFKLPESVVQELEVGETYRLPLDGHEGSEMLNVTPMDANHVPGYFGNILYTGDMRWYPEMVSHPILRHLVQAYELDILYLDNTFCASYCDFPSRREALQQLLDIIDTYPDHRVKLIVRSLGKEDVLVAVARHYCEKIHVSEKHMDTLHTLGMPDVFTTDPEEARIHAVQMYPVRVTTHHKWNEEHPTITVLLTALYVGWKNGPYTNQAGSGLFVVPCSDHSSFPELLEAVQMLRPRKVLPIVKKWSSSGWWGDPGAPDQTMKADMTVFDDFLTKPPPPPIRAPESVRLFMIRGGPVVSPSEPRKIKRPRKTTVTRPSLRSSVRGVLFTSPDKDSFRLSSPSSSLMLSSSTAIDVSNTTDVYSSLLPRTSDFTIPVQQTSTPKAKQALFPQSTTAQVTDSLTKEIHSSAHGTQHFQPASKSVQTVIKPQPNVQLALPSSPYPQVQSSVHASDSSLQAGLLSPVSCIRTTSSNIQRLQAQQLKICQPNKVIQRRRQMLQKSLALCHNVLIRLNGTDIEDSVNDELFIKNCRVTREHLLMLGNTFYEMEKLYDD
ncbi:5' exonuclease Apollo-like isoform X2 [Oratosquilla oratoria]|uniref:5' exonuclease Apollo-like isoform X2 n=1 Tax=Oratosquilla oratoria TaxID=337810 RepID=UPI003F7690AD